MQCKHLRGSCNDIRKLLAYFSMIRLNNYICTIYLCSSLKVYFSFSFPPCSFDFDSICSCFITMQKCI